MRETREGRPLPVRLPVRPVFLVAQPVEGITASGEGADWSTVVVAVRPGSGVL